MKLLSARFFSAIPFVFLCILLFGSYLRIGSATGTVVIKPLRADAAEYFVYSYNLRYKHTYSREVGDMRDLNSPVHPDSHRSPGYPLFLTLFLDGLSFHSSIHKVVIAQAVLSALSILVAFLLFKSFLPSAWALAASLFVAISPQLIIPNSFLISETLFCLLLLVIGYMVSLFASRPSAILAFLTGMLTGLASLVRPILEYLPFLLGLWLLAEYRRRGGLRYCVALFLGFFLAFFPWILRNAITLGTFSDDALLINFLHHGMYPDFTFEGVPQSHGYPYLFDPRSPAISKDIASVVREILRRFQERPWEHLTWFLVEKPIAFWSWDDVQGLGDAFIYPVASSPYFSSEPFQWTHFFMFAFHWPLILFGGLASLIAWFSSPNKTFRQPSLFAARFLSLVLVSYTLIHMVGAPIQRYAFPLRPYLYGMAVFLAYFLWQTFQTRLRSSKSSRPNPDQISTPPHHTPST
jgi:hypothetical protein